jgi:sulfatase maturation enzyme AslB (radical SAM superfamily)
MQRTFRVARHHTQILVHDPCTGVTRVSPRPLPDGRQLLDDRDTRAWPLIHPAVLGRDMPISVCWSPLTRCNLACPHCLDDTSVPQLDAAGRAAAGQIIGGSGVLGVDISGGEPLLLRDLPQLAGSLASAGCAVSITTNGWHLARRAAGLAGNADAIRVSLDGPDPARHDAVRGAGSFGLALDGIAACRTAGLPVQIQTVLMASTARHAQAMTSLAASTGATGITFLQLLPIGAAARMPVREMLGDHAAAELIAGLTAPPGLDIRLRTRDAAAGFTVIRADGRAWRNGPATTSITPGQPLTRPGDLTLTGPDGSA